LHEVAQGLKYLHGISLVHGDLKGVSLSLFHHPHHSNILQANILISNDTSPRACLADFGSITMVIGPGQGFASSVQLKAGTVNFMAPELLVPRKFGKKEAIPTPQADIYAFGLVIFQVFEQDYGFLPFSHIHSPGPYW